MNAITPTTNERSTTTPRRRLTDAPLAVGSERLHHSARPLDAPVRKLFETRFRYDFSRIRIYADEAAAASANALHASAYTLGDHIFFGRGRYDPSARAGRRLLAHELSHVVQQGRFASSHGTSHREAEQPPLAPDDQRNLHTLWEPRTSRGIAISTYWRPSELEARSASEAALAQRPLPALTPTPLQIACQSEEGASDTETEAKDPHAGELVSKIVIDLARARVAFFTSTNIIRGDVDTDLKPGKYKVAPDIENNQWVFQGGVTPGRRFTVSLEGADPWTMTYPAEVEVIVGVPRKSTESKRVDELDILKLLDEMDKLPTLEPPEDDSDPDHFETVIYDLSYRSEKGNLSKYLRVTYRSTALVDINIDTITSKTPRLFAAKQDALKIMDEYNTLFIEGAFGAIFFVLTLDPFVAGLPQPGAPRFRVNRRQVAKTEGKSTAQSARESSPTESAPAQKSPKVTGRTKPASPGSKEASAKAASEKEASQGRSPSLPADQQAIADSLVSEHPGLNPNVAADAAKGGASAAGKGGPGADVPLLNGGGREVSVHQANSPFTGDSIGSHLQQEAMQRGTTEVYLQMNSGTREAFLKILPGIRNAYLELRGVFVKIFGPDGSVWWSGTFGGPK